MADPMEWAAQFREVNTPAAGNGKVLLAYLHPGDVATSFHHSVLGMVAFDSGQAQRFVSTDGRLGITAQQCGAGRLSSGRNQACAQFLDLWDAEWLLMIDADMGFDSDAAEQLVAAADAVERPVMGALCFGAKRAGEGPAHAMRTHFFPTLYRLHADPTTGRRTFDPAYEWPRGKVCEVSGTGAAFLLIHRSVLERIRDAYGDKWFDEVTEDDTPFGEDLSFCLKLIDLGIPLHVHTGVETSHKKDVWVDRSLFDMLRRSPSPAVSVVIPVKDNFAYTRALVGQLFEQGGYDDLLIFDNGTTDPEMVEWLAAQDVAEVFDASGASIHEMWAAGVAEARVRHKGRADVVFLNNDIKLGDSFVVRLIGGLRSDPALLAVSGNYDGRRGASVVPVRGICAGRYDGSGGLAGFAFAVRSEYLETYNFPKDMKWFYGDNDLCLSIERDGGWYGIVPDALVEHLDGGSRTERPADWDEIIEADRQAFLAKWPDVKLVPAA